MMKNSAMTGSMHRQRLQRDHPFISLLQEGLKTGLIDRPYYQSVQLQVLSELRELVQRYTKGESSSIKTETAENLLNSIYYTLDICFEESMELEKAYRKLKNEGMSSIYQQGLCLIRQRLDKAKEVYQTILSVKPNLEHQAYQSTIDCFPAFFTSYNLLFFAHDTNADIDYPLVFDDLKKQGITYIQQYLENLLVETLFLNLFELNAVDELLMEYGRMYRINYKKTVMNLFEPVVNQAAFAIMAGQSCRDLDLSRRKFQKLDRMLKNCSPSQLSEVIRKAFCLIQEELAINSVELVDYMKRYEPLLFKAILSNLETDSLNHLIVVHETFQYTGRLTLDEGEMMEDRVFNSLIKKILQEDKVERKIEFIQNNCCNAKDYMDVLGSGCLFGEEFYALYNSLSEIELAYLSSDLLSEGMREGKLRDFLEEKRNATLSEWQEKLINYLSLISGDRFDKLETILIELNLSQD